MLYVTNPFFPLQINWDQRGVQQRPLAIYTKLVTTDTTAYNNNNIYTFVLRDATFDSSFALGMLCA